MNKRYSRPAIEIRQKVVKSLNLNALTQRM